MIVITKKYLVHLIQHKKAGKCPKNVDFFCCMYKFYSIETYSYFKKKLFTNPYTLIPKLGCTYTHRVPMFMTHSTPSGLTLKLKTATFYTYLPYHIHTGTLLVLLVWGVIHDDTPVSHNMRLLVSTLKSNTKSQSFKLITHQYLFVSEIYFEIISSLLKSMLHIKLSTFC